MDPRRDDFESPKVDSQPPFKADRDEARRPLEAANQETDHLESRIDRLEKWQLVREGKVLMRRYPTTNLRASLAFAAFVAEVAEGSPKGDGDGIEPEIVVGMSSIQVRLIAPEARAIAEPEVSFAEAIDFLQP